MQNDTTPAILETKEIWKPVPAPWVGRYEVSSWGRVRSFFACGGWRRKAPYIRRLDVSHHDGMVRVGLSVDRKTTTLRVNRLVLTAFVGEPPLGYEGSHKDGNVLNNRLDNLCWETHLENERRKVGHGTRLAGDNHPSSKLSAERVLDYRTRWLNGETIAKLQRDSGVGWQALCNAIVGKTWKSVAMPKGTTK